MTFSYSFHISRIPDRARAFRHRLLLRSVGIGSTKWSSRSIPILFFFDCPCCSRLGFGSVGIGQRGDAVRLIPILFLSPLNQFVVLWSGCSLSVFEVRQPRIWWNDEVSTDSNSSFLDFYSDRGVCFPFSGEQWENLFGSTNSNSRLLGFLFPFFVIRTRHLLFWSQVLFPFVSAQDSVSSRRVPQELDQRWNHFG